MAVTIITMDVAVGVAVGGTEVAVLVGTVVGVLVGMVVGVFVGVAVGGTGVGVTVGTGVGVLVGGTGVGVGVCVGRGVGVLVGSGVGVAVGGTGVGVGVGVGVQTGMGSWGGMTSLNCVVLFTSFDSTISEAASTVTVLSPERIPVISTTAVAPAARRCTVTPATLLASTTNGPESALPWLRTTTL